MVKRLQGNIQVWQLEGHSYSTPHRILVNSLSIFSLKHHNDPEMAGWGDALIGGSRHPGLEAQLCSGSEFYPLALIACPVSSYLLFSLGQEQFEIVLTVFGHHCLDFKWTQEGRKLEEKLWKQLNRAKERGLEVSRTRTGMELIAPIVTLVPSLSETYQLFRGSNFRKSFSGLWNSPCLWVEP